MEVLLPRPVASLLSLCKMVCVFVPLEVTGRRIQRVLVPVSVAYWYAQASAGNMLLLAAQCATIRCKMPDAVQPAHPEFKI